MDGVCSYVPIMPEEVPSVMLIRGATTDSEVELSAEAEPLESVIEAGDGPVIKKDGELRHGCRPKACHMDARGSI